MNMRPTLQITPLLTSLVPVICPPEAVTLGLSGSIAAHVELSIGAMSPLAKTALFTAMAAYDQSARLWPPARGRAAHALPADLVERYFLTWWESRLPPRKNFAMALKALLGLACYEMPEMQEKIGYTPQAWIARVKAERQLKFAAAIRKHETDLIAPDPLGPWSES
jgi:hypothetical protein